MLKYLKYFLPGIYGIIAIKIFLLGQHYPTFYLLIFSLSIIIGDVFFGRDKEVQKFSYPFFLNFSLYINLPILFCLVFLVVSFFSTNIPIWYIDNINSIFNIDFNQVKSSFNIFDKFSLIAQAGLFIGMLGIIPGHELTHRKKNKFDMFIGNWLLAFSWDCTFSIEHVYGHHKYVCRPEDPASAKRGENIYLFIIKAIINEQISGWNIESKRLKRRGDYFFSLNNKMIIGHLRSICILLFIYFLFGLSSILYFLLLAFIGKSLLETINYIEHYGLVREKDMPVFNRHSWNCDNTFSGILLCNVTRHSDHHRAPNLKFWELNPNFKSAPTLPYGYLSMIYILLFAPFLYHSIMAKKLIDWDLNYANEKEKELASIQNANSGISSLI